MKFTSTRNNKLSVSFEDALLQGLAPDGGLYIPREFPRLTKEFLTSLKMQSLNTIGETMMNGFISEIPPIHLKSIIQKTLSFPIPLIHLEDNLYLLEVFHGPTLAFKDIGARFMANTLAYFTATEDMKINIIVATSGDTGSAIAHAFHHAPNIDVYILYPSKKISLLQEKQITTFGGNIHAIEVDGTFDDCQRLVKTALADDSIKLNKIVTTANSINIARLLPQMIYHAWGCAQLQQQGIEATPTLVIPSGNLGNLTSAIYAKHMGLSVLEFVAATNINSVFADYLTTSTFTPQPSRKSFANAMDVGNPSNFERLLNIYESDPQKMQHEVKGASITDEEILVEIKHTYEKLGYILDPHTAVGVAAARQYQHDDHPIIINATAHPAKFLDVIKRAIDIEMELPDQLERLIHKPKQADKISTDYRELHAHLLNHQS